MSHLSHFSMRLRAVPSLARPRLPSEIVAETEFEHRFPDSCPVIVLCAHGLPVSLGNVTLRSFDPSDHKWVYVCVSGLGVEGSCCEPGSWASC